jgi:hypothetical protein
MRVFTSVLCVAVVVGFCGCGGSGTNNPPPPQFTIASGDWGIALSPQGGFLPLAAGGSLLQSGGSLSGTIHVTGSPCFDSQTDDLVLTGSVSGTTLSLSTAPVRGQVLSIAASPKASQNGETISLQGSWTLSGGSCASNGTVDAIFVPPINGTYAGTLSNGMTGTVTATMSQTAPDAHGFSHVSGSFIFSGVPCFSSGTIADGNNLESGLAELVINTNDSGQTSAFIAHLAVGALIANVSASFLVESGNCSGQSGSATLKKQ